MAAIMSQSSKYNRLLYLRRTKILSASTATAIPHSVHKVMRKSGLPSSVGGPFTPGYGAPDMAGWGDIVWYRAASGVGIVGQKR